MAAGTLRQSKTQEPLRIGIFHSRLILGWYKTLPARFSHGIFWMTNWEINHLNSGPIPVILALLLVLKDTEHPDFEMFYDNNYQYYIRIRNNMKYLYNFSLSLWYMIYDMWYMIYVIWYMIYDIWYVICDIWYMVYDIWYMIYDVSAANIFWTYSWIIFANISWNLSIHTILSSQPRTAMDLPSNTGTTSLLPPPASGFQTWPI